MPWNESKTVDLRAEFVQLAIAEGVSFSELCRRYFISRKTGYKWLQRYRQQGVSGLHDQSRRPCQQPLRTPPGIEQLILHCRDRYPDWGGRKLRKVLENQGCLDLPAASTITEILRRHDKLILPQEPAQALKRFEHPFPNDLWQMDFKGHFSAGQLRCHPLTVLDDCSRFSLCLQACGDEQTQTVRQALSNTFRRYGLPRRMTMDNGPPWGAGGGNGRFSRLTVWLIEQGITVGHSRPYHPQTQGKDERFHRTLKTELLGRREFESLIRCQQAFNRWRRQYNHVRPHEALDMTTPASRYQSSHRSFHEQMSAYDYGEADEVRHVSRDQSASFKGYTVMVGEAFVGKQVAFRPTLVDGLYHLYFCHQQVGQVDLKTMSKKLK